MKMKFITFSLVFVSSIVCANNIINSESRLVFVGSIYHPPCLTHNIGPSLIVTCRENKYGGIELERYNLTSQFNVNPNHSKNKSIKVLQIKNKPEIARVVITYD